MDQTTTAATTDLIELTAEIVSAYVTQNSVPTGQLPTLIADVHGALKMLGQRVVTQEARGPQPAVSIKKSITPDYIVCLEDGRRFKSLRRHLSTKYGMTPDQYRAKWNLPSDYPMVAPNYAAARSALARQMGLGQKRRKAGPAKSATSKGTGARGTGRKANAAAPGP